MKLVPCRKCKSTKIEIVCRTFSPEWIERFALCQNCGNMSQAIDWGLNEELDTEFTKRQWNYENGEDNK